MKEERYITIDIHATGIRFGVLRAHETRGTIRLADVLLQEDCIDLPANGGPGIRDAVLRIVRERKEQFDASAVCIATAGIVEPVRGIVFHAPAFLPDYADTNWKELIREHCGLPCETDNAFNCAGLAEDVSGAAMSARSSLCLSIGDEVGACIIIDGKIWRGHSLSACAVGYLPMYGSTFETLASTDALVRKVAAIKGNLSLPWGSGRIFEEAKNGDKDCVRAIDDMCEVIGRGISTICYVLNPEIVVLGGPAMTQHRFLLPRIRAAMEKYMIEPLTVNTFIASAAHGYLAPMLGAYYHYLSMRNSKET